MYLQKTFFLTEQINPAQLFGFLHSEGRATPDKQQSTAPGMTGAVRRFHPNRQR